MMQILKTRKLSFPFLIGFLVVPVFFAVAIFLQYRASSDRLKGNVRLWETELIQAFNASDLVRLRKISQSFFADDFESLEIRDRKNFISGFPGDQIDVSCAGKVVIPVIHYGVKFGDVVACPGFYKMFVNSLRSPLLLFLAIFIGFLISLLTVFPLIRYRNVTRSFLRELRTWSETLTTGNAVSVNSNDPDPLFKELYDLVLEGSKRRMEAERLAVELKSSAALSSLAAQVSHDIRSPLAFLLALMHETKGLDESQKRQLTQATLRIRETANNLLRVNRKELYTSTIYSNEMVEDKALSDELLKEIVSSAISEIDLQHKGKVAIVFKFSRESSLSFVRIRKNAFTGILANLLINSIEAKSKNISLDLFSEIGTGKIGLVITDDGKGMPLDVLSAVGAKGLTFDKVGGNGLGLWDAKRVIESWGGQFSIKSTEGFGTSVTVTLPKGETPRWFPEQIVIPSCRIVVIVDDDRRIHGRWNARLVSSGFSDSLRSVSLESPNDLLNWYRSNLDVDALYLCSHHFSKFDKDGLDYIERIGVGKRAILLSDEWNNTETQRRCEKVGTFILPKFLIEDVALVVH